MSTILSSREKASLLRLNFSHHKHPPSDVVVALVQVYEQRINECKGTLTKSNCTASETHRAYAAFHCSSRLALAESISA